MSVVYPSPLANAAQIWAYNRPSYQKNEFSPLNQSVAAANTIYSTGIGISLTSVTGYIYLRALLGSYQSGSASYTIYIYRSTIGIPAAGSQPNASDVQVASFSGTATGASAADNEIMDAIDTVSQGIIVYYYIAVTSNTSGITVTIISRSTSISPPNTGIMGAVNTPMLEAICV